MIKYNILKINVYHFFCLLLHCIHTRVWRMSHTRAHKRHYEATRNEQCLVGSGSFSLTDKLFQSLSNMYC